MESQLTNLNW